MTASQAVNCVAVIDSNPLRRTGVASLLAAWAAAQAFEIEQYCPEQLLRDLGGSFAPRLIVVSIGGDAVTNGQTPTLLRILQALAPGSPVVIMSDREEPSEILFAYRANCRGFVPTNMDPSLALQAITFIANGGTFYPPSALRLIKIQASDGAGGGSGTRPVPNEGGKQQAASPGRSGQDGDGNGRLTLESVHVEAECDDVIGGRKGLTHRQHEVLELLRRGQPNKIIARELGLTEGTVKVHVRQIMRKLGAANRTQAAVCSASEELFYGVGELGLRREHVS